MITLRFGCGHTQTREDTIVAAAQCPRCGETRVTQVTTDRPPRFTGAGQGPLKVNHG